MKNLILILAISSLVISSCKKEETTPASSNTSKSKTDLLCAHYWKLTAVTVNPPIDIGGTQISDMYAQMDECDKDNLSKYSADHTVTYDEGATKCDPSDPQTSSSTWSFNSDETIITEDGSDGTILSLTDSEFKVKATENISGINYTFTITYSKK